MLTPIQIAQETANFLVGTDDLHENMLTRDAIIKAIEKALQQCPVPAGLSDERLNMIEERLSWDMYDEYRHESVEHAADLLAHIKSLHRVMNGPESEALQEAYQRGFEAGRKAAEGQQVNSLY